MLLKDVFDKATFNKVNICTNQNAKQLNSKIHTSLWFFKISRKTKPNQKSRDFCQMFVISKKKAMTLGKNPGLWIFVLCDSHLTVQFFYGSIRNSDQTLVLYLISENGYGFKNL